MAAIATDSPQPLPEPTPRTVLDLNLPDDVAACLLDNAERFDYRAERHLNPP